MTERMRVPKEEATMLFAAKTYDLPRLGVQRVEWDGTGCRYDLYDTELEAWQVGLETLERYRERWADAAALAQRQVDDADMWLAEYRRNLSTNMARVPKEEKNPS